MIELTPYQWLVALAAASQLALASVVFFQGRTSPLRAPFVALCLTLFCWNLASLGHALTRHRAFHVLDNALSPITVAVAIHFILVFVGRRRKLSWLLAGFYTTCGALSLARLGEPLVGGRVLPRGVWSAAFLAVVIAAIAAGVLLLVRHLRTCDPAERRPTHAVVVALVGGLGIGSTELVNDFGVDVPSLGAVATMFAAIVLSSLAIAPSPLGGGRGRGLLVAVVGSFVAVLLYLGVFQIFAHDVLTSVLGTTTLTLFLLVGVREVTSLRGERRRRRERLTWMGRMSDQLAHDLKNPLAAMRGAIQLMQEDRRRGVSLDEHAELIELLDEQALRMIRVIEKYRRLGSIEPDLREFDLSAMVTDVIRLLRHSKEIDIVEELSSGHVSGDPDLLMVALENVLANAADASDDGDRVWVTTAYEDRSVVIEIRDEGAGMDERTLESVFDDFFTTKADGTGLGLAFVKRVMHEHGGDVSVSSRIGVGTSVRLTWPLRGAS